MHSQLIEQQDGIIRVSAMSLAGVLWHAWKILE